jgi:hypothetical protein
MLRSRSIPNTNMFVILVEVNFLFENVLRSQFVNNESSRISCCVLERGAKYCFVYIVVLYMVD